MSGSAEVCFCDRNNLSANFPDLSFAHIMIYKRYFFLIEGEHE